MNTRKTLCIGENNHLTIGGKDVSDLVKEYGSPLYVMDEEFLEDICKVFHDSLFLHYGKGMVSYASKAFCCKEIYRLINKFGLGADVVSQGEYLTAEAAGFPLDKVIYHGNNKLRSEIEYAIKNGIAYFVIDSLAEVDVIDELSALYNKKTDVLIRVNPGVEAHTHHYIQTAKVDSKFGFSISNGDAEDAINYVLNKRNLNLCGLHCHIGSQIFEIKSFLLAVEKMTDFYKYILDKLGVTFSVLDLGGGFGIWYNEDDKKFTLSDYADYIAKICDKLSECIKNKNLEKPFLILEPGRSIVGEAGITLYTVGNVKSIKGVKDYIAIDGGMFENPRYALYQAKYTVVAAEKMNLPCDKLYSIAGKCCESGDLIADGVLLPKINNGDILAVLSTGAYNYSMASNYNRNPVPGVVFVKNEKSRYVVKPQDYRDILRNDI